MIGRKDTVVKQNNDGIVYLFKKNKVTLFPWPWFLREGGRGGLRDEGVGCFR
jgi:dihydrolipoamide dehydrogenase